MNRLAAILRLFLPLRAGAAAAAGLIWIWLGACPDSLAANIARSSSGHFVVYGSPVYQEFFKGTRNQSGFIRLEPDLLAIGAERVKTAVLEQLRISDTRAVPIELAILPTSSAKRPVTILSTRYNDGWQFRMGIPYEVEQDKLIQAITRVVLVDLANRGSANNAEIPEWLYEGFAKIITGSLGPAFLMERQKYQNQEMRGYDLLAGSRDVLRKATPVTFGELTTAGQQRESIPPDVRTAASHLLVNEILSSRDGPARMVDFLRRCAAHLNWQTAFLQSFNREFTSQLDVEKWWSVLWVDFTTRADSLSLSRAESLSKLARILEVGMEYRPSTNQVPLTRFVTLQEALSKLDSGSQRETCMRKLNQLELSLFGFEPVVGELARGYAETLDDFVRGRALADYSPGLKRAPGQAVRDVIKETLARLDALDRKRLATDRRDAPKPSDLTQRNPVKKRRK